MNLIKSNVSKTNFHLNACAFVSRMLFVDYCMASFWYAEQRELCERKRVPKKIIFHSFANKKTEFVWRFQKVSNFCWQKDWIKKACCVWCLNTTIFIVAVFVWRLFCNLLKRHIISAGLLRMRHVSIKNTCHHLN